MDPRYAVFIWASVGLTLAVVVWNVLAPMLTRNQLRRALSIAQDEDEDA